MGVTRGGDAVAIPAGHSTRWIAGLALIFLLLHFVLFDLHRFWEWDEATYVSQVADGWTVPLGSHRARGMVYLVAPVTAMTENPWIIRAWLIVVNTAALAVSTAVLWRLVGKAAAVTAVLSGSFWAVLFFGSEVQPNQFVALAFLFGLLATVFHITRRPTRLTSLALASCTASLFILRPADGVASAAAIVLFGLLLARGRLRRWRFVTALVFVGAVVGSVPWIYEAEAVHGGAVARWEDAAAVVRSGLQFHGLEYLRLLDGPMQGPDPGPIVWSGVAWVGLVLALAALGCFLPSDLFLRRLARAFCVAAVVVAAPYLFYVGATTIRFLLPAYAATSCAAGIGVSALWEKRQEVVPRLILALSLLGVALGLGWNAQTAVAFGQSEFERRIGPREVGERLALLTEDASCRFASQFTYPVIALVSGCSGRHLPADDVRTVADELAADRGKSRFLAFVHEPGEVLDSEWHRSEFTVSTGGKWILFSRYDD